MCGMRLSKIVPFYLKPRNRANLFLPRAEASKSTRNGIRRDYLRFVSSTDLSEKLSMISITWECIFDVPVGHVR